MQFQVSSKVENTVLRVFVFSFCFTVLWGRLVGGGGGNASESLQDTRRPKMQSACERQDHSAVRPDLALGQTHTKKMTRVSVSTKAAVAFYFIFLTPESLSHPSTRLIFARFNGPDSKKNSAIILICQLCTQTQIFPFSNMTAAHTCLHASRSFQPRRIIQGKNKTAKHSGPRADSAAAR